MKILTKSTTFCIKLFPFLKTISTTLMESLFTVYGAENPASAFSKEIPISAYRIAEQSLAPSPIMPTLIF